MDKPRDVAVKLVAGPQAAEYVRGESGVSKANLAYLTLVAKEAHEKVDAKDREWPFRDPIIVRELAEPDKDGHRFVIVDGVHRFTIALAMGWQTVPVLVKEYKSTADAYLDQYHRNLHGVNLDKDQRDHAIRYMHVTFGWDIDTLVKKVGGLSKASISRILRGKQRVAGGDKGAKKARKGKRGKKKSRTAQKPGEISPEDFYAATAKLVQTFKADSQKIIGAKGMVEPGLLQTAAMMYGHIMAATRTDDLPAELRPAIAPDSVPVGG